MRMRYMGFLGFLGFLGLLGLRPGHEGMMGFFGFFGMFGFFGHESPPPRQCTKFACHSRCGSGDSDSLIPSRLTVSLG